MLMPSVFGEDLFDDWFDFDFPTMRDMKSVDKKLYGKKASRVMKTDVRCFFRSRTDVREHEDHFELLMDLPGFKKDEMSIRLQDAQLNKINLALFFLNINYQFFDSFVNFQMNFNIAI